MGLEHKLAMLNATRANLNGTGGGGRTLTPETIAGALGSANEQRGVDLLVADLVGTTDYQGLEDRLYGPLLGMAFRRGWVPPKDVTLQRMVRGLLRLALYEKLKPKRCPACRGKCKRYSRQAKEDVNCERCHGEGRVELKWFERATLLEVPRDQWGIAWASRYHLVQAWLDDLIGTAEAEIRRALR